MKTQLKTWLAGLAAALWLGSSSVGQAQVVETPVLAGQNIVAGTAYAAVFDGTLFVVITTDGGWELDYVHLAIAQTLDGIPRNKKGNPSIGKFPYHYQGGPGTNLMYLEIPLSFTPIPDQPVYLAIHAEAVRRNAQGGVVQGETAWADGLPFGGGSWATYLSFIPVSGADD
jgi:hypothetical protein